MNKRLLSDAQIITLADGLRGTCDSLHGQLYLRFNIGDATELTLDDCQALDALVFQCERCGWWCGQDENAGDDHGWICAECKEEQGDGK